VSEVVHDLRAPLAVMRSQCAELETSLPAAKTADLALLRRTVEAMAARVDELLEDGAVATAPQPVDAGGLLVGIVDRMRPLARARGVMLRVDARPRAMVLGRPQALESAVQNLLDNALRYAPRGTTVRCLAIQRGGEVTIAIQDEGPGVAETDRERVLDPGEIGPGGQTGLGLGMAARIASEHQGSVRLDRGFAGGTCALLTLPASNVRPAQRRRRRNASVRGPFDGPVRAAR
jgi:signal transduction histidine kinase